MREEFIKETKIFEITEEEKKFELLESLKNIKNNLMASYNNMKYAEGDLIDYYIYKIKAEEAQYAYLLKKMKEQQKNES